MPQLQRVRSFAMRQHLGGAPCLAGELLDRFFSAPSQSSFRECYIQITGDKKVSGRLEGCDHSRLRESLGTNDWTSVLGAAVARQLVREYGVNDRYDAWRKVAKVSPIADFRTNHRVRVGGYGDLPEVTEGSPYLALESPPTESASFALTKRGGTETITLEMIRNDNSGAIKLVPKRLADAAKRTLAHFVLDFLRTNPVIYDGITLFHNTHGNLGEDALSASGLVAARAAIRGRTELGSDDRLGLDIRYLFVPLELEETAANLFVRGTNNDKTFVQRMDVEVVPVWYWSDTNDWCAGADPADAPSVEVGFLDGNEEPDIFVQEGPSTGSLFANDQIALKVRHIYGGAVTDYRPLFKSVVL